MHEVDIPVTNLDDNDEDDMILTDHLINNNSNHNSSKNTNREDSAIFYDDFESSTLSPPITSNQNRIGKFFLKAFSLNNNMELNSDDDSESYELQDYLSSSRPFDISGHYKKHEKKSSLLPKILYFFVLCLFMFLLIYSSVKILIFKHDNKGKSMISSYKKKSLNNGTHDFYPTTLVISLDGFHPHYISASLTPFLHDFYIDSYGPPYMIPSFPSSTFPNHWTLVTGLYPEYHGIVGNNFFAPDFDKKFVNTDANSSMDPEFWGGEPVWKTAYMHGVSTAVNMWPGSEVNFSFGNPLEVDSFDGDELLSSKLDKIQNWLDRDIRKRPELILSYVPIIDTIGHETGISGNSLKESLIYVDKFIEDVILSLEQRNLKEIVNLIILSDHGMAPVTRQRLIAVDDYLDSSVEDILSIEGWPLRGLRTTDPEKVFNSIRSKMEEKDQDEIHFKLFKKDNLPKEWHFNDKDSYYIDRIADVWMIPDVGYQFVNKQDLQNEDFEFLKGIHGYNNTDVLMRAIFMGQGPYFDEMKKSHQNRKKVNPFQNVEVYNMICESLHITSAENNGTQHFMKSKENQLPENWKDLVIYPGELAIRFEDSELLPMLSDLATYDDLYGVNSDDDANDSKLIISTRMLLHLKTTLKPSGLDEMSTTPKMVTISPTEGMTVLEMTEEEWEEIEEVKAEDNRDRLGLVDAIHKASDFLKNLVSSTIEKVSGKGSETEDEKEKANFDLGKIIAESNSNEESR